MLAIGAASASEEISDDISSIEPSDEVIAEEPSNAELNAADDNEEIRDGEILSLNDLKDRINSQEAEINLQNNYAYDPDEDNDFTKIDIEQPVVLNGNNHVIDGKGKDLEIYISSPDVTIKNLVFKNFYHNSNDDPFLYWYDNAGRLENCTFENIYSSSKLVKNNWYVFSVDGCTFKNNNVSQEILYDDVTDSSLTNCNFINNTAEKIVYKYFEDEVIDNCNFTNNSANMILDLGAKNAQISNCNFFNNDYDDVNCLVYLYSRNNVSVSNCRFVGNDFTGGGKQLVYLVGDDIKISKCVFENNSLSYTEDESPKPILQVGYYDYGTCKSNDIYLTDTSFIGNQGISIFWNSNSGNITGCTFANNLRVIKSNGEFYSDNESLYIDDEPLKFKVNVYNDTIFGYYPDNPNEAITDNILAEINFELEQTGNIAIYLNDVECYNVKMNSKNCSVNVNSLDKVRTGLVEMVINLIGEESPIELYRGNVYIDYNIYISGLNFPASVPPHQTREIEIELPKGATGTVTLNDGTGTHTLKVMDSCAAYVINGSEYPSGVHNFTVSLSNDPSFFDRTYNCSFIITPSISAPDVVSVGENEFISVDLPDDFNANITVYAMSFDNITHMPTNTQELTKVIGAKGWLKIPIDNLPSDIEFFNITVSGDWNASAMKHVNYIENDPGCSVSIDSANIEYGNDAIVRINVQNSSIQTVIYVDGNYYGIFSGNTTYGHHISDLSVGEHRIKIQISYHAEYLYSNNFIVSVKEKGPAPAVQAKIVAKDYSAYYNKGTYAVTVYGTDGKVAKGANVVFKINGKKIATVKTDAKGVAKVKIPNTYAPKTYKISATALGKTVSKKLTIKQVLKLKKVSVKKSAKKLVITATLKEGKKAIKGKKITFRFNGKKYTAKTNKKGIAKITIKKKVLKNLKKGKKVKYQATYLKDTVKRTVKVKK